MRELSEAEIKSKAEAYCSAVERCPSEVEEKIRKWGASEEVTAQIMAYLHRERYLDAARFCRFYVRDKYRFNQWGRMKIAQMLRMKGLSDGDIQSGLEEIDTEEYDGILKKLLKQKMKSIKAANDYERSMKLIRFAMGRGFTLEEIRRYVNQLDPDEDFD